MRAVILGNGCLRRDIRRLGPGRRVVISRRNVVGVRFHGGVADVIGDGLPGTVVPAVSDPSTQFGDGGDARVETDIRRLGHGVRFNREHSGLT
ncbi:hypothetical protein GCM10009748_17950 [Agromyces lapidis]